MKQYSSSPVLFLATATILLAGLASAHDFCADASYQTVCRSLVQGISDAAEATEKTINSLIVQTQHAKALASKLGKNQKAQTCIENYDIAIDRLTKSLQFLKSHDKASVKTFVSAAIAAYSTCDDAYEEFGVKFPLSSTNTVMEQTAASCLSIYSQVR